MSIQEIILQIVIPTLTIIAGGGWFVSYRAYKRKNEGEAVQAEAEGWKGQQEVYQRTINDLEGVCDKIRADRNLLMEENTQLREENRKLREMYNELENQIIDIKKTVARQGRRIENMFPYTCGFAPVCKKRKSIVLQENDDVEPINAD